MSHMYFSLFLCTLVLGSLFRTGAEGEEMSPGLDEDFVDKRESVMPYWNLWSSDFYGWVEELRAQAAYDALKELAKTYWAHFPIASFLGYFSIPDEEEPEEKETNN